MARYKLRSTNQAILGCVVFVLMTQALAQSPGIRIRLTKSGINYANRFAESTIRSLLQSLALEDVSGAQGHTSWNLKNTTILKLAGPSSQMTLDPEHNAITWTLSQFGASLQADWRVKYKQGWFKLADGGKVAVNASDVSMTTTVVFDENNGRPSISAKSCSAVIGNMNLKFHGSTAFLWNLLSGWFDSSIRGMLQTQICTQISNIINVDAADALSKVQVELEMDSRFIMDYSLIAAPVVHRDYLEIFHKGQVFWKTDKQAPPFSPNAIPEWGNNTSMLNLALTQFTANTFTHAAHHHGYLVYAFTKDSLSAKDTGYLNTTCSSRCIGSDIREISGQYPNSWVEVRINSSAVPQLRISTQGITVDTWATLMLFAHTPDGRTVYLLTLNASLSLDSLAWIKENRLAANITKYRFDVNVTNSNIGRVSAQNVKGALNVLLNENVIPNLNKTAQAGLKLPLAGQFQFVNAKLEYYQGVLLVSTDVQYESSSGIAF